MFRATLCSSSGESIVSIQPLVYVTLCRWPSHRHSDIYQRLYWYNWFSWWWAQGCSKHVEKWNKYIEKNCAPSWSFTKNNVTCFKWVYGQWMNSWVHATMQFVYLSLWHLFQWHEQPSPQHIHLCDKKDRHRTTLAMHYTFEK